MAADPEMGETTLVEFGVLGPLQVTRAGLRVSLGGPRQRAVLAMLLLRPNRSVSLDELVEHVWSGHPPRGAVTTVQTYVFHLRQALEPGRARGSNATTLTSTDHGYLLRVAPGHVDAGRFEADAAAGRAALRAGRPGEASEYLEAALALWRGPVLADLTDYEFVAPQAARLEELRLAVVEDRAQTELALGRHSTLTAELETFVVGHPLREHAHALLMLALYRCGRQADALSAYERIRGLLADQLGIDPGPELRKLHRAVLTQDPAIDWRPLTSGSPGESVDTLTSEPAPSLTPGTSPPAVVSVGLPRGHRRRRLVAASTALMLVMTGAVVVADRANSPPSSVLPANSVSVVNSRDDLVGKPIPVGEHPGALVLGDEALWVINTGDDSVSRIDPNSHNVQTIPVGSSPSAIALTDSDAWVTNSGDGTVSRISTVTNEVTDTITVGNLPDAIASGPSGVWVTNRDDDTVQHIEPTNGRASNEIEVGMGPDGIVVGRDTVWVANGRDGTISRIAPTTGTVSSPIFVGAGPAGLALTDTALWVANALDPSVWKIDPETGRVLTIVPVGDGPHTLAATPDGVWVSSEYDATLTHIDAQTHQPTRRIEVGSSPRGIAVEGSRLWIATSPLAATSHRGGTLTIVTSSLAVHGIDPVRATEPNMFNLGSMVYDGLIGLRRTTGAAGLTLVPNLATSLPRPTNGGKTYTFRLRPGIRYSTGATVRATDFVHGIRRALVVGDGSYAWRYFTGVIGAAACRAHPLRCDLTRGVVTDDENSTITIHLTAPDPDFLHKLVPYVVPSPPGTTMDDVGTDPIPGTGPYQISSYRKGKELTLTRNPYFRRWSHAAQSDGYPDVIREKFVDGLTNQISAVENGDADLVNFFWEVQGGPSQQIVDELAVRYPSRLKSDFAFATTFEVLNAQAPPFNDRRVRQALNYAMDRHRIIGLLGGRRQVALTCQTLPPQYPSYREYCPYTAGAKNGDYAGPNLAKARQLVAESQTRGMSVRVWETRQPALGNYYVSVLRQLGYRASLHLVPGKEYWDQVLDPDVQIYGDRWSPDFPTSSNFFLPLISCAALASANDSIVFNTRYCNPQVDKLIDAALVREQTDPAAARDLWAQVDRKVTDEAPWVAMVTPKQTVFVSARLGNYQSNPWLGPLLDQVWVE